MEKVSAGSDARRAGIELLRILAMTGIVMSHFSFHGGFDFPPDKISVNRLWMQFFVILGKTASNIFVIISGYFLVTSKKFNLARLLRLWLQTVTYSAVLYFVFVLAGAEKFSLLDAVKSFMPISFEQWWFASAYFMLSLLAPFLNILLTSLDRKQYQLLLILLTFCWSVMPTLTTELLGSNDLLWFMYLYALAGYLRLYPPRNVKSRTCFLAAAAVFSFLAGSVVLFDLIGRRFPVIGENATVFSGEQKLPALLLSVLLFEAFNRIRVEKAAKFITVTASATFGVYLLHEDPYVRGFLWHRIFKNSLYQNSAMLIPYSIFAVVTVFLTGTVVELLRIRLFEKRYLPFLEKLARWANRLQNKLVSIDADAYRRNPHDKNGNNGTTAF